MARRIVQVCQRLPLVSLTLPMCPGLIFRKIDNNLKQICKIAIDNSRQLVIENNGFVNARLNIFQNSYATFGLARRLLL